MSDDGDLVLLAKWRDGDAAAGQSLVAHHFESLYRFFASKVDRDVDDLVQQTILACVEQRDRFQGKSSFRTYAFAIARNILYSHWGRQRPAVDLDEVSVASLSTSLGSRLARKDETTAMMAALRELPAAQQVLLELHYWEDMKPRQLAEIFDVEEATARSRLFRAREELARKLHGVRTDEVK